MCIWVTEGEKSWQKPIFNSETIAVNVLAHLENFANI